MENEPITLRPLGGTRRGIMQLTAEDIRNMSSSAYVEYRFALMKYEEMEKKMGRNKVFDWEDSSGYNYGVEETYLKEEPKKARRPETYIVESKFTRPNREILTKEFASSYSRDEWMLAHCLQCFGAYDRSADTGRPIKKGHNCQDFCQGCLAPPVGYTEVQNDRHVCGLDEDQLWFAYQAKVSGFNSIDEYSEARIGSYRSWSVPHIAWAAFHALLCSLSALLFLATGMVPLLVVAAINMAPLYPAVKGITTKHPYNPKILEFAMDGLPTTYSFSNAAALMSPKRKELT